MTTNIIKTATRDLHEELESLAFNVEMFEGNQSEESRAVYLMSNIEIFTVLDQVVKTNSLVRTPSLEADVSQLHSLSVWSEPSSIAIAYAMYLEKVCSDVRPHIYLNYMGFMYGGQIMKKKYPSSASAYEFEDIVSSRQTIRDRYCKEPTNAFIEEVKLGFRWHIAISKDHDKMTTRHVG